MTRITFTDLAIHPFNKGRMVSAKIYAGERHAKCVCGGRFTATLQDEGLDYPICAQCSRLPESFRIRAKVEEEDGSTRYHDIRTTPGGLKFTRKSEVLCTLHQIRCELMEGRFEASKYARADVRKGLYFGHFLDEYLAYHEKRLERGEITPYGMSGKKKYCKVLRAHFGQLLISQITTPNILKFKNSFTDKITTRNLALTELKTVLKHAVTMQKIKYAPEFGRVEGTGRRESVCTLDEVRQIIPHIEVETYRMMATLMAECALRPSEVRALQWRDVSLATGKLTVARHFSINKLVEGRKSNRKGKNARLEHGLPAAFSQWLRHQPTPMDLSAFIFTTRAGRPVEDSTLNQAWARTLQKLGIPHFQMYEMRHARATALVEETGSMVAARDFLGHSSTAITERRYERSSSDNAQYQAGR